jgi:hypothetical protein
MTDPPWRYSFSFGQFEGNQHRRRSADFVGIPEMNLRVSIWERQTYFKRTGGVAEKGIFGKEESRGG